MYIYREREICDSVCIHMYIYIYTHYHMCIYIYIEREREIERERDCIFLISDRISRAAGRRPGLAALGVL